MQRLLTAYTKYYNRKYKKVGHLFQGRFKSIICEKNNYLLELVRYIHLNPYRAGLVKTPADWGWSGHKEYFGESKKNVLDISEVLSMLNTDFKQSVKKYAKFVRDGSRMGKRKDYYPEEKMPYLGNDSFMESLKQQHEEFINKKNPERELKTKIPLKEIAVNVAEKNNVSVQSLCGKTRVIKSVSARKELIRQAVDSGYKGTDIAGFLNCSQSYITKCISRVSEVREA
jgi:hypothetical protein